MNHIWPHLRAALILLHLVAITLVAVPAPGGGMSRSNWRDPTVQAEFAAWSERLTALGVSVTPDALEERLWHLARGYMGVRDRVIAPFKPYYRHAGTWQSWRMFVAPHRFPSKLHVDVLRDGEWSTVYVTRSPEHTWNARRFDHDRFRSSLFRYAWPQYRRPYRHLVAWIGREAAADFPTATRVRVRWYKYRTPSPVEVREGRVPEGRFHSAREVRP